MRDSEGRKKQASKCIQTTRHPSLFPFPPSSLPPSFFPPSLLSLSPLFSPSPLPPPFFPPSLLSLLSLSLFSLSSLHQTLRPAGERL